MTTFSSKFGFVRSVLWVVAAVLYLVLLPYLAINYPSYSVRGLQRRDWNRHIIHERQLAPPVLFCDQDNDLWAWDYRSEKLWQLPVPRAEPFCEVGGKAIAWKENFGALVVLDVEPPHPRQEYKGVDGMPILLTSDGRFAVSYGRKGLSVTDLSSQAVTDQLLINREPLRVPGKEEIECLQWVEPGRQKLTGSVVRVDEAGKLVQELLPGPYAPDLWENANGSHGASRMARWDGNTLRVLDTADNQVLATIVAADVISCCFFSADDQDVICFTNRGDIQAWKVASGEKLAEILRSPTARARRVVVIAFGTLGILISVVLAWQAKSLAVAYVDFVFAIVCGARLWDLIYRFREEQIMLFGVVAIATGVYWTFGEGAPWKRIGWTLIAVPLTSLACRDVGYGANFTDSIIAAGRAILFVVIAMSASLITVPITWFGWRLARDQVLPAGRRFQFSISSALALIAAIAFSLGVVRLYAALTLTWLIKEGRVPETVGNSTPAFLTIQSTTELLTAASISCCVALPCVWLGMWQWTRCRVVGTATIVTLLVLIFTVANLLTYRRLPSPPEWTMVATTLAMLGALLAILIFPFILARRHGYRWIRVTAVSGTLPPPSPANA